MAKYLIEETMTAQAAAGIMQKPEDRTEVLRPIFEAAGCRLEQFYVSAIENKDYFIVEAPDLNSVYTVGATFMAGGTALFLKYTPLLTVPEAVDLPASNKFQSILRLVWVPRET
ncbi:MAG: GYD domain-containing protein [Chloroflexota bacterium]|nr:GYD domain-containing protein [Chloroflexota bacterium]